MFETLELTRMARALAAHAGDRLGLIARNVANADTPGFKATDLPDFGSAYAAADLSLRATRPGHLGSPEARFDDRPVPVPGAISSPDGNTVSVEREMVRAAEVRRDHEMALSIYRATSDIVRASLGRRG